MWGLGMKKETGNVDKGMTDIADKMRKGRARGETQISTEYKKEAKSLVLLQVNCRSIYEYNKAVEFWNLVDTYNPDIIGTESWLREEIWNNEIFRRNF
jgi:hypothetical protein